jgi:hypothetical protein
MKGNKVLKVSTDTKWPAQKNPKKIPRKKKVVFPLKTTKGLKAAKIHFHEW